MAKNYLDQKELSSLNRIVTMYLDYAESQAERGRVMTMADWAGRLDAFLQFNELEILQNTGKVTQAAAKALAEKQYDSFRPLQDKTFESDFDIEVKRLRARQDIDSAA